MIAPGYYTATYREDLRRAQFSEAFTNRFNRIL